MTADPAQPRTRDFARWMLDPRNRTSVAEIYETIATNALSETGLYLNLGFWRDDVDSVDAASTALVHLLGKAAGLKPGDRALDVGYGFGDQDAEWLRAFDPAAIVGLNITESQVETARDRMDEQGLSDRIDLRQGSATDMPVDDATFDKVLALESAFHFDTRDDFFHEAFRVLKPGGRLATADILPAEPAADPLRRAVQQLTWRATARTWNIPEANAVRPPAYARQLEAAGFENVRITSIRDRVYAPLHRHLAGRSELFPDLPTPARLAARAALSVPPELAYSGLDYVIATAEKPS
ncbi:MAG: methyltransferase domain-containing protein [Rhodovibrio sp.]|nr:methyltransferase domain-containing protein [Rhodovibrio sp.]